MDCARVIFSQHAFTRMFARSISPEWVTRSTKFGEVIADYPDDQPFPSCLLLYIEKEKALHVIVISSQPIGPIHAYGKTILEHGGHNEMCNLQTR
jgi:hypothetical protein